MGPLYFGLAVPDWLDRVTELVARAKKRLREGVSVGPLHIRRPNSLFEERDLELSLELQHLFVRLEVVCC